MKKHSEILAKMEACLTGGITVIEAGQVRVMTVTKDEFQHIPAFKVEPGDYGVVEVKLLVPLTD
ncbi:MAG TPA: hypothetical protein PK250_12900 [Syntrophobacter fumaroxidans]|nr:hypothetical protein [Syntrophobacter fumaroxidans]